MNTLPNSNDDPSKVNTISARHLTHHSLHPAFSEKYAVGQELGSGGFGFVVSAYERQTGIERAVKFIVRKKVPKSAWVEDVEMGLVPVEIHVLRRVRHENIIQFCDVYQDSVYFYLVMELHGSQWVARPSTPISRSPALSQDSQSTISSDEEKEMLSRPFARRASCDLFECIEQHKHFDEPRAKDIFRQIVHCVAYLDRLGICHRDIKDENVVIDQDYKVSRLFSLLFLTPLLRSNSSISVRPSSSIVKGTNVLFVSMARSHPHPPKSCSINRIVQNQPTCGPWVSCSTHSCLVKCPFLIQNQPFRVQS